MDVVVAGTVDEWRAWLARHGRSAREVWLVMYHKDSGRPSLRYPEAVEHALCYGWIDGLHRKRDADSSQLRFTPRTARSTWSRINRERAMKLIELGLMTESGQAIIDVAKSSGTWSAVSDVDSSAIPDDLRSVFDGNAAARANFRRFPPSSRRLILAWIAAAKRPETRRRRIEQTVTLAAVNVRANHPGSRRRLVGT